MAVIYCASCKGKCSDAIDTCPHCGHPLTGGSGGGRPSAAARRTHSGGVVARTTVTRADKGVVGEAAMNEKQKAVLWFGVVAMVVAGVYPCWIVYYMGKSKVVYRWVPLWAFFWGDASDLGDNFFASINWEIMIYEWALIAVVTATLIYTLKTKKKAPSNEQE